MKQEPIKAAGRVKVWTTPPHIDAGTPKEYVISSSNFTPVRLRRDRSNQPDFICGSDSEYQTPDRPLSSIEIAAGMAKYELLSYQFHCALSTGEEWCGIICPREGERIGFGEYVAVILGAAIAEHPNIRLPRKFVFAGHFFRADFTAFEDFQDLRMRLNNVRNTVVSIEIPTKVSIQCEDQSEPVEIEVIFRDTMLLSPATTKSLRDLGDLVGVPKETLATHPAEHKARLTRMREVRDTDWDAFRKYAMQDATVCLRFLQRLSSRLQDLTGSSEIPIALSSIGIDLLIQNWKLHGLDMLDLLGKQAKKTRTWNKHKRRYVKETEHVLLDQVSWHADFVVGCYHGGWNVQNWFGPAYEADWLDVDLVGAYATAMFGIGKPNWRDIRVTTDLADFTPDALAFAYVEFEFPEGVRFPCLPVRTDHGLINPRKGRSYCGAPEICAALALGAKLQILHGVFVPSDPTKKIFGEFIRLCVAERERVGKKSLEGQLWKETANSTYGKTAQGLRRRKVYDMRTNETDLLPESRITNPFFAAYTTSTVRALLGEIMNALPATTTVFSCTTDGFLCDATLQQLKEAQTGPLAALFRSARQSITGDPESPIIEVKHQIRQPLGWRTRGQASLVPGGQDVPKDQRIFLAKGGIWTEESLESVEDRNNEIIFKFFSRQPETKVRMVSKVGLREMVNHNADFVDKTMERRLSMEYDWKRCPVGAGWSEQYRHVLFNTEPWETVHQFERVRELWDEFSRGRCLKRVQDFDDFARYVEAQTKIGVAEGKYMRSPLQRLRMQLCRAWRESEAGLEWQVDGMTAQAFAERLTSHGIPCSKEDVHNASKERFVPGSCPATEDVLGALASLATDFPGLDQERILFRDPSAMSIELPLRSDCPFMPRVK